jgi:hypothetical protein
MLGGDSAVAVLCHPAFNLVGLRAPGSGLRAPGSGLRARDSSLRGYGLIAGLNEATWISRMGLPIGHRALLEMGTCGGKVPGARPACVLAPWGVS